MIKRRKVSIGASKKLKSREVTAKQLKSNAVAVRASGKSVASKMSYDVSRLNATKHGILSKIPVLPWESQDEFDKLNDALRDEHAPVGPTEEMLVDEFASSIWRLRRVRGAERVIFQKAMANAISPDGSAAVAAVAHHGIVTLTPNSGPGVSSPMRPERWSYPSWPVPASGRRCSSGAVVGYRRSRCTRIAQPWPRAG